MFRIRRLMTLSLLILALAGCQSSRPAPAPTKTPTAKAPPTQTPVAPQTNPPAISAPAATIVPSAAATPVAATAESTSPSAATPAAISSNLTPQVFIPVAPDQGSNPAATAPAAAPAATPAVGAGQAGQPTAQATSASPASAAATASATPAAAGTAAPAQPAQPTGNAAAAQITGTLSYRQDFPLVGGGAQGSQASGTAQAGTCQAPGATVHLTPSATQVKVGQPLTLTVQLINQGCPSIATAQYHVAVDGPGWPIGLEPVVPPVVTHASPLPQGHSDTAVFVFRATHAGRPEVSATVNYASGVDARGQTHWTWVPSGPVTIVVTQ
jgi:hypothetical protein